MQNNLPIVFHELFQLPSLGIDPNSIGFSKVTMESDKYIAVREMNQQRGSQDIIIIDILNPQQQLRFPVSADSALMHPSKQLLALKAQNLLQIFDINGKSRVKDYTATEEIVFWRWISETALALVTPTQVYHWSMEPNVQPQKMFDRHASLSGCDIVNYRTDEAQKWLLLSGYAARNNQIAGQMQLYSVEKNVTQPLEGHACVFVPFLVEGSSKPSTLFCLANKTQTGVKLFVIEVEQGDTNAPKFGAGQGRIAVDVNFPLEAAADFPIAMQVSQKYDVIYMITKFGFVYLFDIETGSSIYSNRISSETIFVTAPHVSTSGILGINKKGQVLSVSVDKDKIVPFITSTGNYSLAISKASRNNLPGADDLFQKQFDQLFNQGLYKQAAQVASKSPNQVLRSNNTIKKFQSAPPIQGQPAPLLQYFSVLLETSKLNKIESLELCKPVFAQQRNQLIEEWLNNDKISCSEELGDIARQYDLKLSLQIYYLAEAKAKVVTLFAELGQFDKIIAYTKQVGYQPDWNQLFQLVLSRGNEQTALGFAQLLVKGGEGGGSLINSNTVVDQFVQRGMIQQATSILYDVVKDNKENDGPLQTKLLEINLMHGHPQVADALLGNKVFSFYDKNRIGKLCESVGLYHRSLENYSDFKDKKRVIMNTHLIPAELVLKEFSSFDKDQGLEILRELLRVNIRQNLNIVVEVSAQYSDAFEPKFLIEMFETAQSNEGLFRYLNRIVNFSTDGDVHNKYIQAAAKMNQVSEVERVCKESDYYDSESIRDFLMEAKLQDQIPLIIVCDRFGYVPMLTSFLYRNNYSKYIEAYVQQINPANTPLVVGALLDNDCNEDYLKNLLQTVGNKCPAQELVAEAEKRNRLRIIQSWLEGRKNEGSQDVEIHNALVKIYVDTNNDAKKFLEENQFYDSRNVGKYCEDRDPYLAYVAYRRGLCDAELIELTNNQGMFKDQARYLVERQDAKLWASVLSDSNKYKRNVIDQVVQTALPESKNPIEVSSTVQAFMTAELPNELIELLEKIVLESTTEFSTNKNLQNLLILTAIKADKSRVKDYIVRLNNYEAPDIAKIAIQNELFEEAFTIYSKFNLNVEAIDVLIANLQSIDRASEFAKKIDKPEVYSKLARAQLDNGLVELAIESYIKAEDPEYHIDVISASNKEKLFKQLVKYLLMCRKKVKNPTIESELVYAYAKLDSLSDLEEFISGPNSANIQNVGDRCYAEGLYEAARILYNNISNYSRLSSALLKLKKFSQAVDSARKANSLKTWKEVCFACVDAEEFRFAQLAALNIVIHPDHLDEVSRHYTNSGHWDELIKLLEQGIGGERAHNNMFSELACLYSKFKPEKLMEHLKLFHSKLNKNKVIRECENNLQWAEATFLYINNNDPDSAIKTMMFHDVDCWEHVQFKDTISKVSTGELCYKAVQHYIDFHPKRLVDLLSSLTPRIDQTRLVQLVRQQKQLPLVQTYLESVQDTNVQAINEALNELYVESHDYEKLRSSIDTHNNFDPMSLSQSCEKNDQIEFRRIAAYLYRKNQKFEQSIELSKADKLWKDAIDTAAESQNPELAESLLTFFVENDNQEGFASTLLTCYDIVRPDVALELAWRNNILDFVMPYLVQIIREYTHKIDSIEKSIEERNKKEQNTPSGFKGEPTFEGVNVQGGSLGGYPPSHLGLQPPGGLNQYPVSLNNQYPLSNNQFNPNIGLQPPGSLGHYPPNIGLQPPGGFGLQPPGSLGGLPLGNLPPMGGSYNPNPY
eukprot:TRINITY_DN767_c0_g3_i2.p1 TRINITY_DN767_c0_g3~~TRINITY_DN767_c0_g3_i2.p1  ORF type:complete len:1748 (-),score=554.20 TRINITY_DN767_c0_g3_i2:55-5298(-)